MGTFTSDYHVAPHFYRWTFPGSPVRVRLKLDIVSSMRAYLASGFTGAEPCEKGGILLGTNHRNDIAITGFEPFELASSPRFVVSETDEQRFQQVLERWNQPDSRVCAVGYFRWHLGETLALGAEDIALTTKFFPKASHIVLLVGTPGEEGYPMADFFFRDSGRMWTESILPFPFDEPSLESWARVALQRLEEEDRLPELSG